MSFLLKPFIAVALNGLGFYILTRVLDGITYTGGIQFFVIVGVILGIINFLVKPILKIFSFPLIALSGGLFLIVINVVLLFFLSYLVELLAFPGVSLDFSNFGTYVIGAIVLGVINFILNIFK